MPENASEGLEGKGRLTKPQCWMEAIGPNPWLIPIEPDVANVLLRVISYIRHTLFNICMCLLLLSHLYSEML